MSKKFSSINYESIQDGSYKEDPNFQKKLEETRDEQSDVQVKERVYKGYDGTLYDESEWLAPVVVNGPTRQEVEEWKEKYNDEIYFIPIVDEIYVFRALKRPEYRNIVKNPNLDSMQREESIANTCILYPRNFTTETTDDVNAGVPSILSEVIMEKSGFLSKTGAIRL